MSFCWLNAATQLCCCAWWLKADKKETSQHDGILFHSELCFAPVPTLSPGPEIVILLLTFTCMNSIALLCKWWQNPFWDTPLISPAGRETSLPWSQTWSPAHSKLLSEFLPPLPLSWKVTYRQFCKGHGWMLHARLPGGTETYPGTVDLVGSWREDTPVFGFSLVEKLQGWLSQIWNVQVFPAIPEAPRNRCKAGRFQRKSCAQASDTPCQWMCEPQGFLFRTNIWPGW